MQNGQIDADEECDEAAADCINCSVIAVDVSRGRIRWRLWPGQL